MKTILITGANRGIGLETVRQLSADPDTRVLAAVRSLDSVSDLALGDAVEFLELDVASRESIATLQARLEKDNAQIDALINNAGIYTGGKNPSNNVADIMRVNYYGPKFLSSALREIPTPNALIINVSSGMGELSGFSRDAAAHLLKESLGEDELDALVEDYARGTLSGWTSNPYSASKAALNALTRIRFRGGENMVSVCPGWVATDMGGSGAPRSVEKGAETIVWMARGNGEKPGGKFYRDKREINW